jgi:hypothetical protein
MSNLFLGTMDVGLQNNRFQTGEMQSNVYLLRCARLSGQLLVAVSCASMLHCCIVFLAEHAQFFFGSKGFFWGSG